MRSYKALQLALLIIFLPFSLTLRAELLVDGYSSQWTYRPSDTAEFYFNAVEESEDTELFIYDRGNVVRHTFRVDLRPQSIPDEVTEPWKEGHQYAVPTFVELPDLPSNLYTIDGPGGIRSPSVSFIVSDLTKETDVVVIYPTNTATAYARSPNNGSSNYPDNADYISLYARGFDGNHPPAVSFQRPQNRKLHMTHGFDRMLLESDYDYRYISDAEMENPNALDGAKLVVVPGHSEYWTTNARQNFDRFVDAGGSALILSGNTMFRSVGYDDPANPTQLTFWPRRDFSDNNYPTWQSIGMDFKHGGNGSALGGFNPAVEMSYDGWKMLDVSQPYLQGYDLEVGDVIYNPTNEYDGVPYTETDPVTGPVIDHEKLNFHQIDLIAFDNASYGNKIPTTGAWIDYRETNVSGRIINVGSMNWGTNITGDVPLKKSITRGMMDLLLIAQADFDDDDQLTANDLQLLAEQTRATPAFLRFDLNNDMGVDQGDIQEWLTEFAKIESGDANVDGTVDFSDFLIVSRNFGMSGGWSSGDFDFDQKVDFADFLILSGNFQGSNPALTTVPEPVASPQFFATALVLLTVLRNHLTYKRTAHTRDR